jgi:hypothetical protein
MTTPLLGVGVDCETNLMHAWISRFDIKSVALFRSRVINFPCGSGKSRYSLNSGEELKFKFK